MSTLFKLSIDNTGINKWKDVFTTKDIAVPVTLIWGSTDTRVHKHSHSPNPVIRFPNEAVKVPQPQPVPLYKICSQRNVMKIYTIYMRGSAYYFLEVPMSTKSPAKILHLCKKDSAGQALAVDNITSNFFVSFGKYCLINTTQFLYYKCTDSYCSQNDAPCTIASLLTIPSIP